MSGNELEKEFLDRMRTVLTGAESEVDDLTKMRLRAARLRALETVNADVPWYARIPRWITAGGLATAAVAVILAISFWSNGERGNFPSGQVEDIELMTSTNEQLELYQDLEFYRWLENADNAG